jgi:hypothetical protein
MTQGHTTKVTKMGRRKKDTDEDETGRRGRRKKRKRERRKKVRAVFESGSGSEGEERRGLYAWAGRAAAGVVKDDSPASPRLVAPTRVSPFPTPANYCPRRSYRSLHFPLQTTTP